MLYEIINVISCKNNTICQGAFFYGLVFLCAKQQTIIVEFVTWIQLFKSLSFLKKGTHTHTTFTFRHKQTIKIISGFSNHYSPKLSLDFQITHVKFHSYKTKMHHQWVLMMKITPTKLDDIKLNPQWNCWLVERFWKTKSHS